MAATGAGVLPGGVGGAGVIVAEEKGDATPASDDIDTAQADVACDNNSSSSGGGSTRNIPSPMKVLPDVVKSCEDLNLEEKDTQTENIPLGEMAPGPVAVAVVDPSSTTAGSLQQVGALNPRAPPAAAPSGQIPLVNLSAQDFNTLYPDSNPIAVISGNLPGDRSSGDGRDLGEGSRTPPYKDGRTPSENRAVALLSSSNGPGNENLGYDAIHLDVVNSNGKLQDALSLPGSDPDYFECDIPTSPERDSDSPEKEPSDPNTTKISSWRNITSTQRFILAALMMGNIFSAVFYSLLAPFFPTEAAKKGVNDSIVGIILAVFQLIMFIMAPIWGNYITQIGPKFMFVSSVMVTSSCAILFGVLEWCPGGTIYVVMCLAVRSVEALSTSALITAALAFAAHAFPDKISMVMGVQNACFCIGLIVGPPVGGLLFSAGSFVTPFLVTGCVFYVFGFISIFLLPSKDTLENQNKSGSKASLLKMPALLGVGYLLTVAQAAVGLWGVAFSLHLEDSGLGPAMVGVMFLIPSAIIILMAPVIGHIIDVYHNVGRWILIGNTVVSTVGFCLLGPSPIFFEVLPHGASSHWLWLIIVGLVIVGFGWSSLVACYKEMETAARADGFPDTMETKGLLSGIYNAFNFFGAFIGPLIGGVLYETIGFPWTATVFGFMILSAGIVLSAITAAESTCWQQRTLCKDGKDEQVQLLQTVENSESES